MKPENIFILRHGQSLGNVDREIYKTVPDYAVPLTYIGHQEAENVGKDLYDIVGDSTVQFYVSPFWRTRQTYIGIRKSFTHSNNYYSYYEDPRLREQEWGQARANEEMGYQEVDEERDTYGHFYYRFSNGESCADVFDRISDFMGTMFRDFEKKEYPRNVIIVSHGMTMRLFLMRWYHCSVEEFETWGNPANCGYFQLTRTDHEKYQLVTPIRKHVVRNKFRFRWENTTFDPPEYKLENSPDPEHTFQWYVKNGYEYDTWSNSWELK